MKRIVAAAAALIMCLSLASCSGKADVVAGADNPGGKGETAASETTTIYQTPVQDKQTELIRSFGITQQGKKIVCFKTTDTRIEYIVCEYNENGSRKNQSIYLIFYDPSYYNNAKPEFEGKLGYEAFDESCSLKYTSELFESGGTYAQDYLKVTKNMADYTVVEYAIV